jgi:hypothetical protein
MFRTICHPDISQGKTHIFYYDEENDTFRFDNLSIEVWDMASNTYGGL